MRIQIAVCFWLPLLLGCGQAPPPADWAPQIRAANQALFVEGNAGPWAGKNVRGGCR